VEAKDTRFFLFAIFFQASPIFEGKETYTIAHGRNNGPTIWALAFTIINKHEKI